jgi:hypothetical protein
MAETITSKPDHLRGYAHRGPCDGKEFMHTADMRRVRIHDEAKKTHIYVFHEGLSEEQNRRVYLWEKEEAWKFGG